MNDIEIFSEAMINEPLTLRSTYHGDPLHVLSASHAVSFRNRLSSCQTSLTHQDAGYRMGYKSRRGADPLVDAFSVRKSVLTLVARPRFRVGFAKSCTYA